MKFGRKRAESLRGGNAVGMLRATTARNPIINPEAAHPQLALIIDHMGLSIDIAKAGKREEAVAQAAALAKYPNVSVKLSSAPTCSSEPYPYSDMTPFLRRPTAAALPLGHGHDELLRQGDVSGAHCALRGGTGFSLVGG